MSPCKNKSACLLLAGCLVLGYGLMGCNKKNPSDSPPPPAEVSANSDAAEARSVPAATEGAALAAASSADVPSPAATKEPAKADTAAAPGKEKIVLGDPSLTAGIPGNGPLKLEEVQAWLAKPENNEVLDFVLPLGLEKGHLQIKGTDKNPLTRAKIELGRQLYFDPRLSKDATVSCASCHHPENGWARATQFGVGIGGQQGGRNSPVSFNRILSDLQFWDGRAATLEEQAKGPIINPIEMGNTHEAAVNTIAKNPIYKAEFDKVFGDLNIDTVAQAIATFERAIVTSPSPFDYYEEVRPFLSVDLNQLKEDEPDTYAQYEKAKAGADAHPMSESAIRGREIFFSNKGNCTACHVGPNLSDEKYHNIGVGMDKPDPDLGRYVVTKDEKDKGAFKTPTIRNVATTGPYMHDGSQKTLAEVVEWYDKGGHPNPWLDEKIKPLKLTPQEKKDLVAFMEACTGEFPVVQTERLPE